MTPGFFFKLNLVIVKTNGALSETENYFIFEKNTNLGTKKIVFVKKFSF